MAKILKTSTGKIIKTTTGKIVVSEGSTPTPLSPAVISISEKTLTVSTVEHGVYYTAYAGTEGLGAVYPGDNNITALPGYSSLSPGIYTITVKVDAPGYTGSTSNGVSYTKSQSKLAAPTISISTVDYKTITWAAIEHATSYSIYADSDLFGTTTSITFDPTVQAGWASLSYGSHSFRVIATGTGYLDSDPSNVVLLAKNHGRTWVINRHPEISTTNVFTADFRAYDPSENTINSFKQLCIWEDSHIEYYYTVEGSSTFVYTNNDWTYSTQFDAMASRILVFTQPPTGELLTWLQTNAIEQPYEGFTYILNESLPWDYGRETNAINFKSNNNNYTEFDIDYQDKLYYNNIIVAYSKSGDTAWCSGDIEFSSDKYAKYACRAVTFTTQPIGGLAQFLSGYASTQEGY